MASQVLYSLFRVAKDGPLHPLEVTTENFYGKRIVSMPPAAAYSTFALLRRRGWIERLPDGSHTITGPGLRLLIERKLIDPVDTQKLIYEIFHV